MNRFEDFQGRLKELSPIPQVAINLEIKALHAEHAQAETSLQGKK